MNRSIAILAISVAVLISGCGQQTQNQVTVIHLKKPSATATLRFGPRCDASQLSAYGVPRANGKFVNVDIIITNKSGSECALEGLPNAMQDAVRLVGSNGSIISTTIVSQPTTLPFTALWLKPRGASEARLSVNWGNWCNAKPGKVSFRIAFPYNKGMLTGAFNSLHGRTYVPGCTRPNAQSTLQVLQ
ncbi:MAG: hypothetical protein M0Z66_10685 [Thermaerobacter sp.]|nr:hypothetical protein [Thermaerobacter sp.]